MQLRITRIGLAIAPTAWLAHDQHHHHLGVNRRAIQAVTEPARHLDVLHRVFSCQASRALFLQAKLLDAFLHEPGAWFPPECSINEPHRLSEGTATLLATVWYDFSHHVRAEVVLHGVLQ